MIGCLQGQVLSINPATGKWLVTLLVQGIGWEVQVGQRCAQTLTPGQSAQLFTHLQCRDEQLALYGFASATERDLFRQLLRVNGVGPQLALTLLDTFTPAELVQAIVNGNVALLSQTPGVGPKTAQRLALELRQPLQQWSGIPCEEGAVTLPATLQEEITLTLSALGYTTAEISQALAQLRQDPQCQQTTDVEVWIRQAIRRLG
ncbi:MAG: Holliday junction branch migration protein RuvA [Gloeomargarita sp. SKYBB_i_bin120]|nr:Holliday junction branch migration protein RuvA [Gloeomargarita sp. SKYB120]MDW8178486.1 Holliday junction branch migration protein RuvA [Gloeomargarita sp. SKYBB_i_bin120]